MVWGPQWISKRIVVYCDNEAVVEMLGAGYSKEPNLMQLLRCVFFVTAFFESSLRPVNIIGSSNVVADAISRNNLALFCSQVPEALPASVNLPPVLVDLSVSAQTGLHQLGASGSRAFCCRNSAGNKEGVQDRGEVFHHFL